MISTQMIITHLFTISSFSIISLPSELVSPMRLASSSILLSPFLSLIGRYVQILYINHQSIVVLKNEWNIHLDVFDECEHRALLFNWAYIYNCLTVKQKRFFLILWTKNRTSQKNDSVDESENFVSNKAVTDKIPSNDFNQWWKRM